MSQRPVSYAGKRIAPSRRSAPPRKAPSRPAPRPDRAKSAAAPVPGARRRMVQLVISAALLLAVIAMKFLFPAALDRCRATLLDLLGADTDFVEVFSAAGRAFADGSTVSDALNDAYTAVFGTSEIPAAPAVSRSETLPLRPGHRGGGGRGHPRLCRWNGDGYWQQHRSGQLRYRYPRRRFFHSLRPLP